jgi:hypothetical protein
MEYIVYVDSNNRNQTLYPNSNSYTLHLATPIRNIAKAELVSAMLPNLTNSQFISLDIRELKTPKHQTADALATGTVTANNFKSFGTTTSNTFDGSFAVLPIKVSGNYEFYNANYRISTEYPYAIDKLDRLTITWRQPNSGAPIFDTSDLGRNMFILKFETIKEDLSPTRDLSLPPAIQWNDPARDPGPLGIAAVAACLGLVFIIVAMRRKT